jgi:hypothetical protein
MAIGIGPVRVDLVTGECRMLGSLEARDLDLFEVDELALLGPGGWRRVPPELLDAWRAAFDAEPALADLTRACPQCGAKDLHRWCSDRLRLTIMMPCFPLRERREARHASELERAGSASGRKRHPDRRVFQGILFVLHTGNLRGAPAGRSSASVSARRAGAAWPSGRRPVCDRGCTV